MFLMYIQWRLAIDNVNESGWLGTELLGGKGVENWFTWSENVQS